jgi:hypothetical protein
MGSSPRLADMVDLWKWWNEPANFCPPSAHMLHEFQGGNNPFGKECFLCLHQVVPFAHALDVGHRNPVPAVQNGFNHLWTPTDNLDDDEWSAIRRRALGHSTLRCPCAVGGPHFDDLVDRLWKGKQLHEGNNPLEADAGGIYAVV